MWNRSALRHAPFASASRLRALWASAALALAALPGAAAAEAARYELDPVHTRVVFAISHAGYSQAIGTVSGSTGTLVFDPEDWRSARVEVQVPLQRLDLGDAKWNRAALARNLLDAERHPLASFVSTRVEPVDGTHANVTGTLTLHGVSREATLAVTFNQLRRYPLPPFRRTAGFSATATLSRSAFGIDAWPSVIGDAVELRIEAEARRVGGAVDGGEAPAPPAPEAEPREPLPPRPEGGIPDAAGSEWPGWPGSQTLRRPASGAARHLLPRGEGMRRAVVFWSTPHRATTP